MKLPKNIVEGALQIGEKKYVLFTSFVLCAVEENDQPAAVLFRPGEISCINTTPTEANPFSMETAALIPDQIEAASVEEAAAIFTDRLMQVSRRIIEAQASVSDAPAIIDCGLDACCGNDPCTGSPATDA
jgi:hypothetical protein